MAQRKTLTRALKLDGPVQPINATWDSFKLRAFQMNQKRHTIRRALQPHWDVPTKAAVNVPVQERLRQGPAEYFNIYTRTVIPQIEARMEERLLFEYLKTLKNDLEKEEIRDAYFQRRHNLSKLPEEADLFEDSQGEPEQIKNVDHTQIANVISTDDGYGLNHQTFADIGKYVVFPTNHMKRMFPTRPFGRILEEEYETNQTFGLMCREQGLRLANDLSRLTLPHERAIDYARIARLPSAEVKADVLQDETFFTAIVQDIAIDLLDWIDEVDTPDLRRFFRPPGVFDGVVSVLAQEMHKKPMRPHLCCRQARKKLIPEFVRQIREATSAGDIRSFAEVCEVLPIMHLQLEKANLEGSFAELQGRETIEYKLYLQGYHKFCYHHWLPYHLRSISNERFKGQNTGVLLWGEQGAGKSQLMSYLTAWAHENSWVCLSITDHESFVDASQDILRYKNGLYLQPELASRVLKDLLHSNEQIWRETPVRMDKFGLYDITGIRDDEPEPCPRAWDPVRKTWTDAWKEHLYEPEINHFEKIYEKMDYRLSDKCADPKTLYDIGQAGVDDPQLATNAIGELVNQCYHSDTFQTLFCVDGINTWYMPSAYPSFRYANNRKLKQQIPPHDIALCRLLMNFDGHMIRNGVKMMATSHYRQYNHMARPEDLNGFEGYTLEVENLTLNDFRNAMYYYGYTGLYEQNLVTEWRLENLFMECQGNLAKFHHSKTRYLTRPY